MTDDVIYSYLMEATGIKDAESLEFLLGWLCEKSEEADQNGEYMNLLYEFEKAVGLRAHLGAKNAHYHLTTDNGRPRVVGAEISDDPWVEYEHDYMDYDGPELDKEKEDSEEDSVKNIFKRVDDLQEIRDRIYEHLMKGLQIDNEYALEEYLYKCEEVGTLDEVLKSQGLPEFLDRIKGIDCSLKYIHMEECTVWDLREKKAFMCGPRLQIFVLAPYEHLEYDPDGPGWGVYDNRFLFPDDRVLYEHLKSYMRMDDEQMDEWLLHCNEVGVLKKWLEEVGCNSFLKDRFGEDKIYRVERHWDGDKLQLHVDYELKEKPSSAAAEEDDLPF